MPSYHRGGDDEIAKKQAHTLARHTRKVAAVIVGIHLDNITQQEIAETLENADNLVDKLIHEKL